MFENMIHKLKENSLRLVFPEGQDVRIQQAAVRLQEEGILTPILLGNPEELEKTAAKNDIDLSDIETIDPLAYDGVEDMVKTMAEIRKGKMTQDECRELLKQTNYFGTMLVQMEVADGLLGGVTYSTADTVRPALQIIRTKPDSKIVSSCFIMHRVTEDGDERYAMADCAINLFPDADQLAEIAIETARTAKLFDMEPKVAMLSFSTKGSGRDESVDKMRLATEKLQAMNLDFPVDGELQFDAAVSPEVGLTKAPNSKVAGHANTFVFPDINAGNIGYKIAQRLGGFEAYGPILMGLNAPINDLSRGANTEEVYKMAIITAATALNE